MDRKQSYRGASGRRECIDDDSLVPGTEPMQRIEGTGPFGTELFEENPAMPGAKDASVANGTGDVPVGLPIAASIFALIYAILLLSELSTAVALDPAMWPPWESPAVLRYVVTHLVAGCGLFVAGITGIVALKKQSDKLLLFGELLGSGVLAAIVLLQTMSLWTLQYLE
jgi:hypothetical protein